MSDQSPMVCKVCRRALARREANGAVSWEHFNQDRLTGHKPVPVDPATVGVRGRCDFCNEDASAWILPARSFTAGRDSEGRIQAYEGDWAACDECAKLIDRNAWDDLLLRVQRLWEVRHHIPVPLQKKRGWKHLWRLLRPNISGSLRPIS